MNELIWFSVPGAIVLVALSLSGGDVLPKDGTALVGLAPVVGFTIHQLFRVVFEAAGGWHWKHRSVVTEIASAYGLRERHDAFLVWELAFYSNDIPEPFRAHDRGAWHYTLSFLSCTLAAVLSGMLLAFLPPGVCVLNLQSTLLATALLFGIKAYQTFRVLNRQEVALFTTHRETFNTVRDRLFPPPSGPK